MTRSSKQRSAKSSASEQLLRKPAFWVASTVSLTAIAVAITVASFGELEQFELAATGEVVPVQQIGAGMAYASDWGTSAAAVTVQSPALPLAKMPTIEASADVNPEVDAFAAEHLIDENGDFGFVVTPQQEARYKAINTNASYPDLETRMIEMQARRDGKPFDAETVLAAIAAPAPWAVNDSAVAALELTAEEQHDGREFLSVDRMKIESLVPGDVVELPVAFEGGTMQMEVERVEVGTAGAVTWHGRITDFEEENQVSITQGAAITIGGITTPNGVYMVESRAEAGWIVPTGTLFKNTEEEDGILPPDNTNS
ncbi:hypothetical protein [Allohahella marinimesophila]|uniref:Uncharacterized protein n=1 Tax=Allohahella marinimesophila TaxID=1054972 RepID=A0ABP7PMT4_9GAMM